MAASSSARIERICCGKSRYGIGASTGVIGSAKFAVKRMIQVMPACQNDCCWRTRRVGLSQGVLLPLGAKCLPSTYDKNGKTARGPGVEKAHPGSHRV